MFRGVVYNRGVNALTPKQREVLGFVQKYSTKRQYAPSLEEIKKHFRLRSLATVHEHLATLESKGYLRREKHQPRGIVASRAERAVRVPIVGTITAGAPLEALENPLGMLTLSEQDAPPGAAYYALRVAGDSMVDEGIFDGDTVVIRKQETAENGQTVVAVIDDNQATLKKIYREKNRFRLQPANQSLLPFYRSEVEVRGVVVKIIRDLEAEMRDHTLAYRKRHFLERIRSANPASQNKYKRVALSPIRYAGGKSLAVGHIVELLPDGVRKVVSPFFGGGSLEIALSKELGLEVIGYDIFDILCNYWKFQIENPGALYEELKKLKPNKTAFEKIRLILNDVWKKRVVLDPLTLAVYYVYNFNLSYGPGFMGWSSEIYLNEARYKRMLENIRTFAPGNLKVKCADFREVITKHPNDFLYCDPPYYIGKDSKMFRGIYPMRNIPVHHNGFKHEELRDLLKNHKGGWILSYNNCPTIREYYKEFAQSFPSWQYTMGQGETRIGTNRKNGNGNHIKESHEILIYCPPRV